MADAGFKLTVEGEKEFRKAISDVNAILKLNQAELQRVTAEYNASDKSVEAMTERQKELGGVIDRQTAIVEQMEGELARLTDEYGDNATGVVKMQAETEKARATLANLNAQFKSNAEEIEAASKAAEEYGSSMEEIDEKIAEAEEQIKAMDAAMKGNTESLSIFGESAGNAEKKIADLEKKGELLTSELAQQESKLEMLNSEMQEAVRLYGSQSKEAAEYRVKIAETSTEIEELTRRIEKNNLEIEGAKNPANDLSEVFSKISDITGVQIPEGLTSMVGGMGGVTAAAGLAVTAVAGIAKAVADATKEAQSFAAEIRKLSNQSGLSPTQVEELQFISKMLDVEYESVADAMKDLTEKMYDASTGNEELAAEFNDLGVRIYETNGELRSAFDVLTDLIDAYGDISNKTERAARMQIILGESSRNLNTLIYAGGDAIKQYREQAHEWAYVMDGEVREALEVAEQKTRELDVAWQTYWRNVGANAKISWNALMQGDFKGAFSYDTPWAQAMQEAGTEWFKLLLQKMRGYSAGTYNHPGGYAVVGEEGPEIVDLPAGSRVYPNGEFSIGGNVNYYNVTISAADIREFNDIVRILQNQRVDERMK